MRVLRTAPGAGYADGPQLRSLLAGHDAAVSVLGPGAVGFQRDVAAAAEAAGVRRLVVDDFGWGPSFRGLPEMAEAGAARTAAFDFAAGLAGRNGAFTWTGVTIGNPIDWVPYLTLPYLPTLPIPLHDHLPSCQAS